MGHSYVEAGGYGDYSVVVSNPSGTIVQFTIDEPNPKLTLPRMIRAILVDAINQWLEDNRASLDANGDSAVKGPLLDVPPSQDLWPGFGFAKFNWNFGSKYASVELTSIAYVDVDETYTVEIPYGDVV